MMKKVLMIAATLMMAALVTGPVMAQGGMGGFQMPPELTKAMDKMRTARKNRMMIGRTVRAIAELNKDPKTALTKDQAKKVTAVLDKWAAKPDMTEDQAKQVSKELTAPLSTNISQIKKLAVEMQANNRMGGGGGGGRPGGGGGMGGGRPGGGGAAGGGMPAFDPKAIARRIEDGLKKPYNPMNPGTWGDDQWVQRMKDSYGNAVKDIKAKAK
jgi:polyhydroxyalkanoate synthesis regulator phasin